MKKCKSVKEGKIMRNRYIYTSSAIFVQADMGLVAPEVVCAEKAVCHLSSETILRTVDSLWQVPDSHPNRRTNTFSKQEANDYKIY